MARRNRVVDIQMAQQKSLEFARQWLSSNSLGLPENLPEEAFENVMNAITRGLVQAYVKGYAEAADV